jgi:transcriptional regulator with XRE-family HTH domain
MINIFHSRQLRRIRRAFALTQKDLAFLLGIRNTNYITKLENGHRRPSHHILSRLTLIFDAPPHIFIPDIVDQAIASVHENTLRMRKELSDKTDRKSKRKVELLDAIMSRMAVSQYIQD